SRIKKTFTVFLLSVFCANSFVVPVLQANLWQDRRAAVQELNRNSGPPQGEMLLAQLPSVNFNVFTPFNPSLSLNSLPPTASSAFFKSLSLPLAYSNLKKTNFPPRWTASQPLILHIQDVHLNKEAQKNIGR